MYFFGKKLKNDSFLISGFYQIFGIGKFRALELYKNFGYNFYKVNLKFTNIKLFRFEQLLKNAVQFYEIERILLKKMYLSILHLKKIRCYRGMRHNLHLPVRGQRTHTNGRTCKKISLYYSKKFLEISK